MPQPASKVKWNGSYVFGNDVLTNRPELGCLVAAVIAGWSVTEAHLGRIFANLVGSKQSATMSMYTIVRSEDIKRDPLRAAAADVLPKRYVTVFLAALNVLGRAGGIRHEFAHGIWGAPLDPVLKALLLVEPRHFWSLTVAQNKHLMTTYRLKPPKFETFPQLDHEHIMVYRLRDLTDARARVERSFAIAQA